LIFKRVKHCGDYFFIIRSPVRVSNDYFFIFKVEIQFPWKKFANDEKASTVLNRLKGKDSEYFCNGRI